MNKKKLKKAYAIMLATLLLFASENCLSVFPYASAASTDAQIYDIFNRNINNNGIDLVDWQGYIANPYIKLTVKPPASASFPVTINLKAEGTSRLMMDLPSQLSATGATKTLTFTSASDQKNFLLEIHPDRIGGNGEIENYNLALNVVENNGISHTQNIPIRVLDQDDNRETSLPLKFDYRYDTVNHVFNDTGIKNAAERAIKDWFYFFNEQPFDTVASGAETNFVPNDNFNGNTNVTNNEAYNGEWIFLRGLNEPYSTGWNSNNGNYHKRNGVTVPGNLYRSLGAALQLYAGKTPFTSLDDEQWYLTDNGGSNITDIYGLIMHEFGHGFAYSDTWPGVNAYKSSVGNDPDVVAYQGISVPLDSSYHIPGDSQYWDRLSGQTGGWGGLFPERRWMFTKLSLLIAENAGWKLDKMLSPFIAPQIVTGSLPNATKGQTYSQKLSAKGGVPFYDWKIVSGSLPAGLSLDMFTGTISGTVSNTQTQSNYTFTVQLRDYDDKSTPVTKVFTINTGGGMTSDVVANYLFNETNGTTASDSSGNGNNATLNGSAAWTAGKNGNAVSLNGSTAYASLPTGITSTLNDFTVSTWVRVNASADWSRILDFGTGTSNYMFLTPKAGGGGLRFAIKTTSGTEQQINASALATGLWKHVAVTLSGTTGILYVDGAEVARNSSMTYKPSSLGSTSSNFIGKSQFSDPFLNGLVDDFKIYNRALSASEISTIAGGTTAPANIAPQGTSSTSFVSTWESLAGLNDSYTPTSSNDRGHSVYGNWDNPGSTQWVQYDFSKNFTISSTNVYWFADGDGIDVPDSYTIQYWNSSAWVNVGNPTGLGVLANQYNTTTFTAVSTNKIRLNIKAKASFSTGIESWKVNGL